jgi:hypothetical protein
MAPGAPQGTAGEDDAPVVDWASRSWSADTPAGDAPVAGAFSADFLLLTGQTKPGRGQDARRGG